jgi:hypothetical protein
MWCNELAYEDEAQTTWRVGNWLLIYDKAKRTRMWLWASAGQRHLREVRLAPLDALDKTSETHVHG